MKIIIQVGTSWGKEHVELLRKYSKIVQEGVFSYVVLSVEEFEGLEKSLDGYNVMFAKDTEFTNNEVKESTYGFLTKIPARGYPQPEIDFDYLKKSYDLTDYCDKCGTGAIQINPLRIEKEIKWKKPGVFCLNWIFDELLIEKEYYQMKLKPLGIDSLPVIIHKTNEVSTTTVQLKLPVTKQLIVQLGESVLCDKCNHMKYFPQQIGFFSGYEKEEEWYMFKTQEYFGSGGLAYRRIVMTRFVQDILMNDNLIGLRNIVPVKIL